MAGWLMTGCDFAKMLRIQCRTLYIEGGTYICCNEIELAHHAGGRHCLLWNDAAARPVGGHPPHLLCFVLRCVLASLLMKCPQ